MKQIIYIIAIIAMYSCKKDGISPKDERNDCVNCTATVTDAVGNPIGTVDNTINYKTNSVDYFNCVECNNYCDYLHWLADKPGIKINITCN